MTDMTGRLPAAAEAARGVLAEAGAERLEAQFLLMTPNALSISAPDVEWPEGQEPPEMAADELGLQLYPMMNPIRDALAPAERTVVQVVAEADGPVQIDWFESPGLAVSTSQIGTLKLGRKRRKGSPPPVVPLTSRMAENDLAEIQRHLSAHGHSKGYSETEIARAEARRKQAFPPELRVFFAQVRKGVVLDVDAEIGGHAEVVDGLLAGTGKVGNVVDPAKRWLSPNTPLPQMPSPTPDDVVQPVYATPGWIVFADDGGGNAYAVDLVPGPKGRIGQIVQFDHERDEPPELIAWSLTDFLAGRRADAPRPAHSTQAPDDSGESEVTLDERSGKTSLVASDLAGLTRLTIGQLDQVADLSPLIGHASLEALEFRSYTDHLVDDLTPLRTLVSLEQLSAPLVVWQAIAAQNAWPPALVTAEFSVGLDFLSAVEALEIANAALVQYGKPPIELHSWQG